MGVPAVAAGAAAGTISGPPQRGHFNSRGVARSAARSRDPQPGHSTLVIAHPQIRAREMFTPPAGPPVLSLSRIPRRALRKTLRATPIPDVEDAPLYRPSRRASRGTNP